MNDRQFRKMLEDRQTKIGSLVCVGLDPLIEKIPIEFKRPISLECASTVQVLIWMRDVVDKTAPFASMFKPNTAFWESIPCGTQMLYSIIEYINRNYPEIPVFLDCKRGDIGSTQERYRVAHFDIAGADGINYSGWMGVEDTLKSLIDPKYPGRALVGLGRTSNPSAWEIQDRVGNDGMIAWEHMVDRIFYWSAKLGVLDNAGIVMGAAHAAYPGATNKVAAWHLVRAREIVGSKMWILIPGIGAQGGFVKETVMSTYLGVGSIAINSSSQIIFADDPAGAAEHLRDEINMYI